MFAMQLSFDKDHLGTMDGLTVRVIDEDSDDHVGDVAYKKGVGREVTLFGRYKGTFSTHAECAAFLKGVETVLNHMIG
jgi:hypothetical protein